MSRLLYLLNQTKKSTNALSKLVSNTSKKNTLNLNSQLRFLASEKQTTEKKFEATNELDKPQWERSDRFVSF